MRPTTSDRLRFTVTRLAIFAVAPAPAADAALLLLLFRSGRDMKIDRVVQFSRQCVVIDTAVRNRLTFNDIDGLRNRQRRSERGEQRKSQYPM